LGFDITVLEISMHRVPTLLRLSLAAAALMTGQQAAASTIVDVSAANGTGSTVALAAGTYTVKLPGRAGGGAFDVWSPWTTSTGCNAIGADCTQGYAGAFAIDFGFGTGTFNGIDGFQHGFVAAPGNSGLYETSALALAAYRTLPYSRAPLPQATDLAAYSLVGGPIQFTLASAQQVRFFIVDNPYGDNREGISLSLETMTGRGGIPEPATWAMMIMGFGLIGGALRQRKAKFSYRLAPA
jgi:PEP-CTERM motif